VDSGLAVLFITTGGWRMALRTKISATVQHCSPKSPPLQESVGIKSLRVSAPLRLLGECRKDAHRRDAEAPSYAEKTIYPTDSFSWGYFTQPLQWWIVSFGLCGNRAQPLE
jgi:hypothetical protein